MVCGGEIWNCTGMKFDTIACICKVAGWLLGTNAIGSSFLK